MRPMYRLLVLATLLALWPTFNKLHAQHGPGQPQPMYEGLRETLNWFNFSPGKNGNTAARPTEIRSRFIATTLEQYQNTSFKYYGDSLRMHWHDTAGAGFDYLLYAWGSMTDYMQMEFWNTAPRSPRAFMESHWQPFDTMSYYAASPGGTGFQANVRDQTIQFVQGSNRIDSARFFEDGQTQRRQEYFYDASGKRVATRGYILSGPAMLLANIDSLAYDNNGNLVSKKLLDMTSATPSVSDLLEYTYDGNNSLTKIDHFMPEGGSLILKSRAQFINNTAGKVIDAVSLLADPVTNVLENKFWEGHTYNASNQVLSFSSATWSGSGWDTTRRVLYEYGTLADHPLAAYVIRHTGPAPSPMDTSGQVRWFFDSQDLCDSIVQYSFTSARKWFPFMKTTIRYNDFDQVTFIDQQSGWNNTTGTWSYRNMDFRSYLYYQTFNTKPNSIKDAAVQLAFSVYPNPVLKSEALHIRSAGEPVKELGLYDLSGKLRIRQTGSGKQEVVLSVSALAPGAYILQVQGDKHSGSKKIVVR